jgi:hypothetical protein
MLPPTPARKIGPANQDEPIFLLPEAYEIFVRLVVLAVGICMFFLFASYGFWATSPSHAQRGGDASHAALQALLAPQAVAAESSDRLTFVAIQLPRQSVTDDPEAKADMRRVKIDLTGAARSGLVVYTAQNVELNVVSRDQRPVQGTLGLESRFLPVIKSQLSKPLSRFIVNSYATRPIAPGAATPSEFAQMCGSFINWTQHYGLRATDVKFVLFRDPTEISFSGHAWVSNGRLADQYDGNELKSKCRL